MHRTQIYLDDLEYRYLKDLAKTEGKSMAAIIRTWIKDHIKKRIRKKKDPLLELSGIIKKAPKDMASKFDKYLYGEKNGD